MMADEDQPQSLLGHLNELRSRIVKIALGVVAASLLALIFANGLKDVLAAPYLDVCSAPPEECFQLLAPAESFSVLMRVAVFGGLILASPVVLYQIWAFVSPALTSRERKWAIPVISVSVCLFLLGVAFGYWSLPRAFRFFLEIFDDVESRFRLAEYFSFVIRFLLAFGVSFMYPVFLFGASAAGLISSRQLATGRRWAVLAIVVVAAAITPTGDVLTLTLLSAPLYLFYEITYWLVRLVLRK
ncbi:MAG: twin-arginine translocase subunit TatC [Acidimicrobiia bacterium]|nr:twin-arginine translocase subunit TatC [Acidimicrobiia bacterium]MDH4309357.1 twin-arginine translocase subunit TatC [Acidimicrobiia bacterium]